MPWTGRLRCATAVPHLIFCVSAAFSVVQVRSWADSAVVLACALVRAVLVVDNCCAHVGGGTVEPASRLADGFAASPAQRTWQCSDFIIVWAGEGPASSCRWPSQVRPSVGEAAIAAEVICFFAPEQLHSSEGARRGVLAHSGRGAALALGASFCGHRTG